MASTMGETDESVTIDEPDLAGEAPTEAGFGRVLVAVDGETPAAVGRVAIAEAARHGARVDALSIVRMTASVDGWDMLVERREDSAETALEAVEDVSVGTDVTVSKRLRYGDPAEEIARYAAHNDIDLVVIGEPTRTGLRRYLSPTSVTDRVRRASSVPVLTVPDD
ncbi:UspA domain-containing protein [Natrinema pellirubrum DSM 15624]|uniref:Universal stress protein UspA-like protein n=1 Tax=Natrinema pellirubrum (strain DSM 15624 / CIP 106293 / JCM 10476 / NCIMB 786 / 157) TaxID=797303 RepID=L0JMQ4_NATP1|nr:universal stress protein [Natrinema pellirubrum]AGB32128.1 universal stress protein UspA-like protein [Natrinema pellirubrum DSM 15624]ELY76987.1 UspA domain-containing protein [Natrinema pellirubrum DSM 15624]